MSLHWETQTEYAWVGDALFAVNQHGSGLPASWHAAFYDNGRVTLIGDNYPTRDAAAQACEDWWALQEPAEAEEPVR